MSGERKEKTSPLYAIALSKSFSETWEKNASLCSESSIRKIWYKANERSSLFALTKVHRYLKNQQNNKKLNNIQKKEIRDYWGRYGFRFPYDWHKLYYEVTGAFDPSFVPNNVFHYGIKYRLNNKTFSTVWSDKCYLDYALKGILTPKTIVRNINGRFANERFELIDIQKAKTIIDRYNHVVIKPSVLTDTGKGVSLLECPFNLERLDKIYKKNYIIQLPIYQHEKMGCLNGSSVNTIRINSALLDTEALILSAFVKVGEKGAFADNSGHNRYFIGITEDGVYKNYAIDHDMNKYEHIPSGYTFPGKAVPSFEAACETVRCAHKKIPHFGLAFWDVCILQNGQPMIVEVNLRSPDTYVAQATSGPFFGKHTKTILNYISRKA